MIKSMLFELTNHQRKYLGLELVKDSWEKVKFNDEIYLYFDGDTIKKRITVSEDSYVEAQMDDKTKNREILLPKTSKGKPKKLNYTGLMSKKPIGVYFNFTPEAIRIASFTTQTTFYSTHSEEITFKKGFEDLNKWLEKWMNDSSDQDLKNIQAFAKQKRKHVKFKEGDFFAFKVDRWNYGFGRVLFDVYQFRKKDTFKEKKNYGLKNLMGKPVLIKIYHHIGDLKEINLEALKDTRSFPSDYTMDNNLFYGEYQIIGYLPLEEKELEFPVSYGRSIYRPDKNTVYLQWGLIFKEDNVNNFDKYLEVKTPSGQYRPTLENPYRNEGCGFSFHYKEKRVIEQCIESKSNQPYWDRNNFGLSLDLRHPDNNKIKEIIFKHFGLDQELSYLENLKLNPDSKINESKKDSGKFAKVKGWFS